jgi:hypothetical protein
MLSDSMVRWAETLLAQALSQREVARRMGIARATVRKIAAGCWRDHALRRRISVEDVRQPVGIVGRCPACGLRVRMPCLVCLARSARMTDRRARLPPLGAAENELPQVELEAEDQARYGPIHARKTQQHPATGREDETEKPEI